MTCPKEMSALRDSTQRTAMGNIFTQNVCASFDLMSTTCITLNMMLPGEPMLVGLAIVYRSEDSQRSVCK